MSLRRYFNKYNPHLLYNGILNAGDTWVAHKEILCHTTGSRNIFNKLHELDYRFVIAIEEFLNFGKVA